MASGWRIASTYMSSNIRPAWAESRTSPVLSMPNSSKMTASFCSKHLPDPVLDRVLEDEVDRADDVGLADAIHPADALFEPHRVPGDVVVDHHMAELEVQAFPAGVGGDQDAGILGEGFLDPLALFHVHRTVQADDREPALRQKSSQHLLGGHELGEHQRLELRVAFFGWRR